jgi:hypothetical protein
MAPRSSHSDLVNRVQHVKKWLGPNLQVLRIVLNSTAHFFVTLWTSFSRTLPNQDLTPVPCSIPKLQHVPKRVPNQRWHQQVQLSCTELSDKVLGLWSQTSVPVGWDEEEKTAISAGKNGVMGFYSTQFQTCPCSLGWLDCRENLETMKYRSFLHFSAGRNACKFRFYPLSPFWILDLLPIARSFLSNSCQNK